MKRIVYLLVLALLVMGLSACDSAYEITGLESFSENCCSIGTCDGLVPADRQFLSEFAYESGDFFYWTDGDYIKAKAFLRLQYSAEVYSAAKAACEEYYGISQPDYQYGDYTFRVAQASGEDDCFYRMFGYNDARSELVFIGYADLRADGVPVLPQADLSALLRDAFGEYF